MKSILQNAAAVVLPLLVLPADAASPLVCNTRMGTKSVGNVPTTTTTVTASLRPTLNIDVRSTVTRWVGATSTYTWLQTETQTTTETPVTDTWTSTTTEIDTDRVTVPSTITTTITNTQTATSTSTTTMTMTQGFRNIQDSLNSKAFKRELNHPHGAAGLGVSPAKRASGAKQGVLALAYPSRVDCTSTKANTNTLTNTRRLAPTTVTVPYWAYRTYSASTITTTSTVVPDHVTSTETETDTTTVTVSTTTFQTNTNYASTTATALMHGPTVWNACNDRNYFGPNFKHNANGATFDYFVSNVDNNGAYVGSNYKIVANGAGSVLECCNYCMKFGTCETFLFREGTRNCFLMYHEGETCPTQGYHPNFFLSQSGQDTGAGYQVGNGYCGYTYSGNSDSSPWQVDSW